MSRAVGEMIHWQQAFHIPRPKKGQDVEVKLNVLAGQSDAAAADAAAVKKVPDAKSAYYVTWRLRGKAIILDSSHFAAVELAG